MNAAQNGNPEPEVQNRKPARVGFGFPISDFGRALESWPRKSASDAETPKLKISFAPPAPFRGYFRDVQRPFGFRISDFGFVSDFGFRISFLVLLLAAFNCSAETTTNLLAEKPLALSNTLSNTGPSLLRVLGALAIVLGLFLGGVWLFRNGRLFAFRRGGTPRLNVLESRSLGGRQALYVVGYDQERFLLAATPAGINLLSHLPTAAPGQDEANDRPANLSFAQALTQVLKGQPNGKAGSPK
jgi:flagellar biogenesis protein FliO